MKEYKDLTDKQKSIFNQIEKHFITENNEMSDVLVACGVFINKWKRRL